MNFRLLTTCGLAALAVAAAGHASASTTVVINPSDSTRKADVQYYNDNDPVIHVGEGEEAVIYYDDQSTERVEGPFDGRISQIHNQREVRDSTYSRIAAIYAHARERRSHFGASRAPGDATQPLPDGIDPLDINLDTTEMQCYLRIPIHVWQYSAKGSERTIISYVGGGAAELDMPAGAHRALWPAGVGIAATEGTYVVSRVGSEGATHEFKLRSLTLDDPSKYTIADLVNAGCNFQAEVKAEQAMQQAGK